VSTTRDPFDSIMSYALLRSPVTRATPANVSVGELTQAIEHFGVWGADDLVRSGCRNATNRWTFRYEHFNARPMGILDVLEEALDCAVDEATRGTIRATVANASWVVATPGASPRPHHISATLGQSHETAMLPWQVEQLCKDASVARFLVTCGYVRQRAMCVGAAPAPTRAAPRGGSARAPARSRARVARGRAGAGAARRPRAAPRT
jgi:hypothetical protein